MSVNSSMVSIDVQNIYFTKGSYQSPRRLYMILKRCKIVGLVLFFMSFILVACSKEKSQTVDVFGVGDHDDKLTIHFFHIKGEDKSDAMLIRTPKGKNVLIDAGMPSAGPRLDEYLNDLDVKRVDIVLSSHPHIDHIGGFETIFRTKDIGKVIETNVPHTSSDIYNNYRRLIEKKNIDLEYAEDGDVFRLEEDILLEILNPPKGTSDDTLPYGWSELSASGQSAKYINNVSMVVKLTYKENSFLFTGDIYQESESNLIELYGDKLEADVLKAPHHGDSTSSSIPFIKTVNPKITIVTTNVIQSKPIHDIYRKLGSDVYVTGGDGNILVVSDGKMIDIFTEKSRENDFLDHW